MNRGHMITAALGLTAGLTLGLLLHTHPPRPEPARPSAPTSRDPAAPWPGP